MIYTQLSHLLTAFRDGRLDVDTDEIVIDTDTVRVHHDGVLVFEQDPRALLADALELLDLPVGEA